jgi:hypothetical protein
MYDFNHVNGKPHMQLTTREDKDFWAYLRFYYLQPLSKEKKLHPDKCPSTVYIAWAHTRKQKELEVTWNKT